MKVSALLHRFLEYHARERPGIEFGIQGGRTITYREADALANRFAHALVREGLRAGDRIAYLSKNSIDMAVMYLGASKAGVVPVPLNYRLAPPEWAWIIRDSGARVVFAQAAYVPGLETVRAELDGVRSFVCVDVESRGWLSQHEWLAGADGVQPASEHAPSAVLYQMYTSGTTGRPKGAMLTHENVVTNTFQSLAALGHLARPGERLLIVMPMYHAGATSFVIGAVINGATMVFQEDFVPRAFLHSLEHERIVAVNVVPAMIQACLGVAGGGATGRDRFPELRCMIYGASPIAEATLKAGVALFGCDFHQGFGQTESAAVLTFLSADDHRRALAERPGLLLSAGRAVPGTEIAIMDEAGAFLPSGEIGEIVARGPQVMQGYWGQPEQTARTLAGGWLHTGDAGLLDEDGYLYIRDRLHDMIVSGGENVYPREVENVLYECPGVTEAAVIGVPDETFGEAVLAVLVCGGDSRPDPEDIVAFCRGRLAGYKIPRRFEFVAALPRLPSGKVLKRELREAYWAGRARRVS